MSKHSVVIGLLLFIAGFLSSSVISDSAQVSTPPTVQNEIIELQKDPTPSSEELLKRFQQIQESFLASDSPKERSSPHNWVKMEDIYVGQNQVRIAIDNPEWALFTNTNSMDPVIDAHANAIQIIPESIEDVHVGDIVAYRPQFRDGLVTHRVINISEDNQGWYAILKGDNNPKADPGRIRFSQIERVVVAIIY